MLIHFNYLYSIQQFQKATLSNFYNKILKQIFCGADRDRTCDPRVANAMLSQLSYSP